MIKLNPNDKVSANFKVKDLYHSSTAIKHGLDNTPSVECTMLMIECVRVLLQPLRSALGVPIQVNSFYRAPLVNRKARGSKGSQHQNIPKTVIGVDIDDALCRKYGVTNKHILTELLKPKYNWFKVVYEKPNSKGNASWIHISYSAIGTQLNNARFLYLARIINGKMKYHPFNKKMLNTYTVG